MAVNQVQQIRGTTAQTASFTGNEGVISVDTTKKTLVVHDGVTAGGHPLAKESITFSTDSDALLKFNNNTSATLASNIAITMDKAKLTQAVIDEIKADDDLVKDLVPELVSDDTDNALEISDSDGKLFVKKQDASALIDADDKILSTNSDKEIISTLGFSYAAATGKFTVTGKGGAQVAELTIPSAVTSLKTAEVVVNPSGQPAGTYLHFVFATQSGTDSEMYINVTTLVDTYTAGNGLQLNATDNHKFELKLAATGNMASIDANGALLVTSDFGDLGTL